MSYQTVKEGLVKVLMKQGFTEGQDVFSFDDESDQSINRKYRLDRSEIGFDNAEYLNGLLRPEATYTLGLAFKMSNEKPRFDYDVAQNVTDALTAYIANPANFVAFCTILKINGIKSEAKDGFLEVTFALRITDDLTLT